jgi:hypothetical protein
VKRLVWMILLVASGCATGSPRDLGPPLSVMDIVVSPGTAPEGLTRDSVGSGRDTLAYPLLSDQSRALVMANAQSRFVEGGYATFSGEAGALLSLAMRFDSAAGAERVVDILVAELESAAGYGLPPGSPIALGDGGLRYEGDVAALGGLHEIIFVWRRGEVVLIAGGPMAAEELENVAESMNERAGDSRASTGATR